MAVQLGLFSRWFWRHRQVFAGVLFLVFMVSGVVWAQTAGEGPSVGLSKRLYCYAYTGLSSQVGLFISLAIGIVGLFTLFGGRLVPGIVLIMVAALLPAITSTMESFYEGLASFLYSSGLSTYAFNSHANGFDSLGVGNSPSQCDSIYVAPIPAYNTTTGNNGSTAGMGGSSTSGDNTALGNNQPSTSQYSSCTDGSACPRWQADNNPGNIRAIPGYTYPGQVGVDNKGFAQFDSMSSGLNQLDKQTSIYSSKYGVDTIGSQINRYAPPSENQTSSYVSDVVSQLRSQGYDVNSNTSVSQMKASNPDFANAYTSAIAHHETGKWIAR